MGRQRNFLVLLTSLLLFSSFPPFGHPLLAFFALLPLLFQLPRKNFRGGARLSFLAYWVFYLGHIAWVPSIASIGMAGVPAWILFAGFAALPYALVFGCIARYFLPLTLRRQMAAASLYALAEMFKEVGFSRFNWGVLGYSQSPNLFLAQLASLGSVYSISFLLVFVNLALFQAIREREVRKLAPAAGLLLLALVYGYFQLAPKGTKTKGEPSSSVTLLGVQPGVSKAPLLDPNPSIAAQAQEKMLQKGLGLATRKKSDLIVFPETFWPEELSPQILERLPKKNLLVGAFYEGENAALLIDRGQILGHYGKRLLVPFGEWVPFYPLFLKLGYNPWGKGFRNVRPGKPSSLQWQGHPLGVTICYEGLFSFYVRREVARGAQLLLNITADSWFPKWMSSQQVAMLRFRAIENHRYLLRVADVGFTVAFDPEGREMAALPWGKGASLSMTAPLLSQETLFSRAGEVLPFIFLIFFLLGFFKNPGEKLTKSKLSENVGKGRGARAANGSRL